MKKLILLLLCFLAFPAEAQIENPYTNNTPNVGNATGTLPVANGGTGVTAASVGSGGVVLASGVVGSGSAALSTSGSWIPTVTASGTAGTPSYTTHVGSYVQIGTYVYAQFDIVLSGWTGSPTGNVSITGLPVTSTSTTNDNGGCLITSYTVTGLASTNYGVAATIAPSSTSAVLFSEGNTGIANVTAAQTGTTPTLIGFCNYHT